jgi:dTDP-4-amino-4,6-dideoxygalactose transaminase
MLKDLITGKTAHGDSCERLETEIRERYGVPHALCLPQERLGIHLAVRHLVMPGKKVVLSPYTIADAINMVIVAGCVPVFADIDRATTNVSAAEIERLIDDQVGGVIVTHLHGIACEIEKIAELCRRNGIPLIEDCAQAFGARLNGKMLGSFGDAGIFSFGMYKSVTSFYGGMLVTHRSTLDREARHELASKPYMPLSRLGGKICKAMLTDVSTWPVLFKTIVYWIFRFGYLNGIRTINNVVTVELDTSRKRSLPDGYLCRMRPSQARMVLRQLPLIDELTATRVRYARIYHQGLRGLPDLVIPPFRADGSSVYNYFPVQYRERVALVKWMMLHRRDVAVQHLKNCAALPSFAPEHRDCPNADSAANETILLPNYPSYGENEVHRNVEIIRAFFNA